MLSFEQAVRVTFQEEALALDSLNVEAKEHLRESSTLRRHIVNACRELDSCSDVQRPAVIAAMVNAFFEFGYRTHRHQVSK